jgi:SPP1 gp7 family putative phage head morphogenesis protein
MPSVNDSLKDAAVRHQVFLLRYANGRVTEMGKILRQAEKRLTTDLEKRLNRLGPLDKQKFGKGKAETQRVIKMRAAIQELIRDHTIAIKSQLTPDLKRLANIEIERVNNSINSAVGADLNNFKPSSFLMNSILNDSLVRGKTLNQWFKRLERGAFDQVDSAVSLGLIEGQTTKDIIKNVKGSLKVVDRHTSTLVRTTVNAVATKAREQMYAANSDIVSKVEWVATLDGRTSPICQSRDGKEYEINKGPRPPAHPNCRSTTVPVLKSWEELSNDPLKPGRGGKATVNQISPSTRASMDGQVSADLTYPQWLKRQSREIQDDILGPARGKLFRAGTPVDKFVDARSGRAFTLDELDKKAKAIPTPPKYTKGDGVIPIKESKTPREGITQLRSIIAGSDFRKYPKTSAGRDVSGFSERSVKDYGKVALPQKDMEPLAFDALAESLVDANRLNKDLGLPPIRGIKNVTARNTAMNMGDGVVGVNSKYLNRIAKKAVGKDDLKEQYDSAITRQKKAKVELLSIREERVKLMESQSGTEWQRSKDYLEAIDSDLRRMDRVLEKWAIEKAGLPPPGKYVGSKWTPGSDLEKPGYTHEYFSDPIDKIKATFIHEHGHHVHQLMDVRDLPDYYIRPVEKELPGLVVGRAGETSNASEYMLHDTKERFAESWALYHMGRKDLLPAGMINFIERKVLKGQMPYKPKVRGEG